jgi:2-dehydro-3-deoxyphosphogluconate aldolase / (4S)-4-hydroxy-2-oxoglutarate aldolase
MRDILGLSPVVPVVTLADADDAVPMARALLAGGINVVEVTLRTAAGMASIRAIAAEVPEMTVGAGTVLTASDADGAIIAGARFLVSPGLTPALLADAARRGTPYLPGVASASEVMLALEHGFEVLKIFPAAALGITTIKTLAGPFPQVRFCANGGMTIETAPEFLGLPNVLAVGATWITPESSLADKDWAGIEARARAAAALRRA